MGFFDLFPWQVCVTMVLCIFTIMWLSFKVKSDGVRPFVFLMLFMSSMLLIVCVEVWTSPNLEPSEVRHGAAQHEALDKCRYDKECADMLVKYYKNKLK